MDDSHASSSHEVSLEPAFKRREDLGKHNVHTHFPKDRNCEICKRTKITRATCRRRNSGAVLRAEIFSDLITADHKVLSDNCESRNNHRYAVVVQDLATQWIQAYPCKPKLHKKPREACKSSWNPRGNQKSFTLTILWNSAKLVKISPGSIARLHHTDRRLMGLLKEQCAEWRKAPLLCCCNQVWMKIGGQILLNISPICETSQVYYLMEDALWKTFWATISRTDYSIWFIGWVSPYNCEGPVKNPSIWKESLTWIVPRICSVRGGNLEGWRTNRRPWGVGDDGRIGNLLKKTQCERGDIPKEKG